MPTLPNKTRPLKSELILAASEHFDLAGSFTSDMWETRDDAIRLSRVFVGQLFKSHSQLFMPPLACL